MPKPYSRASSTDDYPLRSLSQRNSMSSPSASTSRLAVDESSSEYGARSIRSAKSMHGKGKGKKRISDEGSNYNEEEQGLLAGLHTRDDVASLLQGSRPVSDFRVSIRDGSCSLFRTSAYPRMAAHQHLERRGTNPVQYRCTALVSV